MAKQEKILSEINADCSESIVTDESLVEMVGIELKQYDARDVAYTDLLSDYIKSYNSKRRWNIWYKLAFFIISMLAFVVIIGGSITAIIIAALKISDAEVWSIIAVAISGVASTVSSIIVLPKIIANHLFPTDEDKNMIDMVKNMQRNDSGIRDSVKYASKGNPF